MLIKAERRISASRAKVWRTLSDPARLDAIIPDMMIERDASVPDTLRLRRVGARPILAKTNGIEPFSSLGWSFGANAAGAQSLTIRLADMEDGERRETLLSYELTLEQPDAGADALESTLTNSAEQALDRFVEQLAKPAALATGNCTVNTPLGSKPAGEEPELSLTRLLHPKVIGGVLFAAVLVTMLGLV